MEGYFLVKDNTFLTSKSNKRKCHLSLEASNGKAVLQYYPVKFSVNDEPSRKTFVEGEWLVFLAETKGQTMSMALVKPGALHESLIIEAKNENKTVLKAMEQELRKVLRVISYDVIIRQADLDETFLQGVVHVFPDKLILTRGFPPDLDKVLTHSLLPRGMNGMEEVGEQGLWFPIRPDICVYSEHRDNLLRTLQGCMRETPSIIKQEMDRTKPDRDIKKPIYQNLARPLCYMYMNIKNGERQLFTHNYANMFNMTDTNYKNWKNCQRTELGADKPPPRPPRTAPPPLPPRPRNRLPNSPLPPLPMPSGHIQNVPAIDMRELQLVLYCSKPLVGHFWVIQMIFMRKNDDSTFQRIKKLEEDSSYQLLKPLPELIKVIGDLRISLECSRGGACSLRSDKIQVVSFEVVKDVTVQSCWMMIEFHLEHDNFTSRSFHGRIVLEPTAPNSPIMARKDILISSNFKEETLPFIPYHPATPASDSLKSLGVKRYFELCNMLDIPSSLGKDWMGLAGEVGLTVDEVFKIQSKALFPSFSPTNEVLSIWSQREHSTLCTIAKLREILQNMRRFDILETVLDDG